MEYMIHLEIELSLLKEDLESFEFDKLLSFILIDNKPLEFGP